MKKTASNEHLAAWEADIRQDERITTLAGLWGHIHSLEQRAVKLLTSLEGLKMCMPLPDGGTRPTLVDSTAKRMRPTPVPSGHLVAAQVVLDSIEPAGTPLTPTQIAETWGKDYGGRKMAALACETLVAKGLAEKCGRKGYRAKQSVPSALGVNKAGDEDISL